MPLRILVTADNHLDLPSLNFGPRRFEKRRDHMRCFEEAVAYAMECKAHLFLICGDLFDTIRPGNSARARVMDDFRALDEAGVRVFLIGGNHDTPRSAEEGASPLAVYDRSGHAHFFDNPAEPASIRMNIDGVSVKIRGIGFNPFLAPNEDPLKEADLEVDNGVNILLLHYPIEGFEGYAGEEPLVRLASIPDYQLVAAGHFHKFQTETKGSTLIVSPGSTERASFHEDKEEKGFALIEIEGSRVEVEQVRTQARKTETIALDVSKSSDIDSDVSREIEKRLNPDLILRARLKGVVKTQQLATYRRSDLIARFQDSFFAFFADEQELEIQSPELAAPLPRTTPLQELRRYFETLVASTKSRQDKQLVKDALALAETRLQEAGAW